MTLTECLRRVLARRTPDGRTMGELLVEMVLARALAGDIRFIRLVFERVDGPVERQAVEPTPAAGRVVIEPAESRAIPPQRRRAV